MVNQYHGSKITKFVYSRYCDCGNFFKPKVKCQKICPDCIVEKYDLQHVKRYHPELVKRKLIYLKNEM